MTDEPPSRRSGASSSTSSWMGRLAQIFNSEPQDRDDLLAVLRDAEQRSLIGSDALAMIEGAIQVSDLRVRDIMVPRADMVVVQRNMTPEEMLPVIVESGHSRFPVIGDSRDELIGILLAKDLLRYYQAGYQADSERRDFDLKELLRSAVLVPESKRLNVLLAEFRSSRHHMAVVVDEFAGIAGLVTIEDVLEQIVGEIDDEHDFDDEEGDIRQHGQRKFSVKARTQIEDFNAFFEADLDEDEFDTIGGLVTQALGHVPERGDTARIQGFDFKVLRADSRRVHLLRVVPVESEQTDASHSTGEPSGGMSKRGSGDGQAGPDQSTNG